MECRGLLDQSFDDKLLPWGFPYPRLGGGGILAVVSVTSFCDVVVVVVVLGIGQLPFSVG